VCVSTVLAGGALFSAVTKGAAQGAPTPAFSGTAAADGVRATLTIPGAPLSEQLVDVGGPSAQVAVDSIGTSTAFAAFPDPGGVVQSAPGLLSGLLNQGAFGLPPIPLPSLPKYPLLIKTDGTGTRDATLGAGPYSLKAHSAATSSNATAMGGLQTGVVGNVATVTSSSSVLPVADGSVVATSTVDVQGLTIGPVTLAGIRSTATMALNHDGTITSSSKATINALEIGGLAVGIDSSSLTTPGPTVPLPIGSALNALLGVLKINLQLAPTQKLPGKVIAPALLVTMPLDVPLGTGPGTLSLTLGGASASMSGSPTTDDETAGGSPGGGSGTAATDAGSATNAPSAAVPDGGAPVAGPDIASVPPSSKAKALAPATRRTAAIVGIFDISSLYLAITGCALAAYTLGHLIRLMGVRARWTSTAG
jgi:hypothetical protein